MWCSTVFCQNDLERCPPSEEKESNSILVENGLEKWREITRFVHVH